MKTICEECGKEENVPTDEWVQSENIRHCSRCGEQRFVVEERKKEQNQYAIYGCQTCGSQEIRPRTFRMGVDVVPCRCGGVWYMRNIPRAIVPVAILGFWRDLAVADLCGGELAP